MANKKTKKILTFAIPVLLAVIIVFVLELTGVTHLFRAADTQPPLTASQHTKGIPKGQKSTTTTSTTGTSQTNNDKNPNNSTSTTVTAPTGNFVSSHHVTANSTINSVCNTNPGASCQISFISGSTTKSLAVTKTDDGGAAYWNWTPQSIGLATGNWQIKVNATLGSNAATAQDAMDLTVTE